MGRTSARSSIAAARPSSGRAWQADRAGDMTDLADNVTMASAKGTLNEISATEIARRIAAGEITAEAVVEACLERIAAREPAVHAWASLDPDLVRRRARELDRAPSRGPLHGVPLGVKDVLDTADQPTEMGSPIYRGYRPVA